MFAVTEIIGQAPGKTLFVTGGMDGDEYAGIEAAKRIIEKYADREFSGRLIIIPVVNEEGFKAGTSKNPIDGKFPKYIYPGKWWGSASSRLMHKLSTEHVHRANAWHDLHGGASDEHLEPFVWLYNTGVESVDKLTRELIKTVEAETILFERVSRHSKPHKLARRGINYILAESGELGERDEVAITRHIAWVETTMAALGMIERTKTPSTKPTILTKISYEHIPVDRLAEIDGTLLWRKSASTLPEGKVFAAIGRRD